MHFDRLKPCPDNIRIKPVGDEVKNSDASSDHRVPAQPPGSQLQFYEENDQDVMMDPGTRNKEQEPDRSDLAERPPAPIERSNTAPELAPGINSEGADLESETAVSPASRSGESAW